MNTLAIVMFKEPTLYIFCFANIDARRNDDRPKKINVMHRSTLPGFVSLRSAAPGHPAFACYLFASEKHL